MRGRADEVRRPQAGGRADDRGGAHPRDSAPASTTTPTTPRAGRPAAAPVARRAAAVPGDHDAGGVGARHAGAVRRRQPLAALPAVGVEIVDGPRRVKERHLKMAFKQDGKVMRGMAWRAVEREEFVTGHRDAIDLAFSLEQDTWNGERYLQLSMADFKAPARPSRRRATSAACGSCYPEPDHVLAQAGPRGRRRRSAWPRPSACISRSAQRPSAVAAGCRDERLDPKAMLESTDGRAAAVAAGRGGLRVKAERTLNYEDGSSSCSGVRISVRKRDGRDFVVTAREAAPGKDAEGPGAHGQRGARGERRLPLTTDDATYTRTPAWCGRRAAWRSRRAAERQRRRHDLRQEQRRADAARRGRRHDGGREDAPAPASRPAAPCSTG